MKPERLKFKLSFLMTSIFILGACSGFKLDGSTRVIVRPKSNHSSPAQDRNSYNNSTVNRNELSIPIGPADAPSNQSEGQKAIEQANLSIQWESTEIISDSGQHAELVNLFSLNNQQISTTTRLDWSGVAGEGDIKNCNEDNIPYEVDFNAEQTGPQFWAVGKTVCLINGYVHVALDFFTWNQNGLISEKVLLNISETELASLIVKEFSKNGAAKPLPQWVNEIATK